MKAHFQRTGLVIFSLILHCWIAQSEITEFYFSENSWRNRLDHKKTSGIQQITHHATDLSEESSLVLEDLKNAEYLSPLPRVPEDEKEQVYFAVETFFPLRPMIDTSQGIKAKKSYPRHDTKTFMANVNFEGKIIITANSTTESEKPSSLVVLTYFDDNAKNAAALVVADTDAILHSATDGLFFDRTQSPLVESATDVSAAAFLSAEANLLGLAFVLFCCFCLLALFKTGKVRKIQTELASKPQPLTAPRSTDFLENKILLELVSSPRIGINKFSKTDGFQP